MVLKVSRQPSFEERFQAREQRLIESSAGVLPGGLLSPDEAAVVAEGFATTPITWDEETFRGLGMVSPDADELGDGLQGDAAYNPNTQAVVTPEDVAELAIPVRERAMAAVVGGRSREVKSRDLVYDVVV